MFRCSAALTMAGYVSDSMDDDIEYLRVTGVSYYQEALERCSVGEPVRFVHEPDNPYDETALRVVSMLGETMGYAPRGSWAHHLIHERGRGVSGRIHSMGYSRACLIGVMLSIAVCDDEVTTASYYPDRPAPDAPPGGFRYWIKSPSDVARLLAARR
jgi:hypothetical protein